MSITDQLLKTKNSKLRGDRSPLWEMHRTESIFDEQWACALERANA